MLSSHAGRCSGGAQHSSAASTSDTHMARSSPHSRHPRQPHLARASPALRHSPCPTPPTALRTSARRHPLPRPPCAAATSAAAAAAAPAPSLTLQQLDFGCSAAQGQREGMEDEVVAFHDAPNGRLYAGVYDGHCGAHASLWLKNELYTLLSSHLPSGGLRLPAGSAGTSGIFEGSSKVDGTGVFGAALTKAFLEADRKLIAHLARLGPDARVEGSTATAVIVTPGASIVVAHVGDSQAVLCREGRAVLLATPHLVGGTSAPAQAEIARITAGGGWIDDGRVCGFLAVSRALGDYEYKGSGLQALLQKGVDYGFWDDAFAAKQRFTADPVVALPAVSETPLTAGDELLVLASDGLWDVLAPAEAVRWARNGFKARRSAADVAAQLVELALKRNSADNISVVVVDLVGQGHWNPPVRAAGKPGPFAAFMAFWAQLFSGGDK